jgi:hypothetical protein
MVYRGESLDQMIIYLAGRVNISVNSSNIHVGSENDPDEGTRNYLRLFIRAAGYKLVHRARPPDKIFESRLEFYVKENGTVLLRDGITATAEQKSPVLFCYYALDGALQGHLWEIISMSDCEEKERCEIKLRELMEQKSQVDTAVGFLQKIAYFRALDD